MGRDESTTARRSASARRSWRASSRPTGRSATRCATWSRTCTTSIRPPTGCRLGRLEEVDRYILARYADVGAADRSARTTTYDFPDDLPGGERVRDGRPQRVLRRRLEGSAVHLRRPVARAAFGADGDVPHRRRAGAADRADALPVTADELWRYLPGTRDESVHLAVFPDRGGARHAASIAICVERLDEADGAPRTGARRNRAAAEGQARSAARCRRRCPDGGARRISRSSNATRAHLPMLFIVSEVELRAAADARDAGRGRTADRHRAGRRREVRALLALRAGGLERPGVRPGCATAVRRRWLRRSMVERLGRPPWRAAVAPLELWSSVADRRRSTRSRRRLVRRRSPLHDSVDRRSGVPRSHARPATPGRRSAC